MKLTKRSANKILNACRKKCRKRLDRSKLAALDEDVKKSLMLYIVSNRGPVVVEILPADADFSWLASCGYFHRTVGAEYEFLHTSEHIIT